MSNKVLNNLIFSRMQKRKAMTKSMRQATTKSMRKVTRKVKRQGMTKSKRKVARKVKTRRAKRRTMKGGDYKKSVVDQLELIPVLPEKSKDLSVSIPGFGTVDMKAYRQYMQDLDTRGPSQM
jgi:hypothetical protein